MEQQPLVQPVEQQELQQQGPQLAQLQLELPLARLQLEQRQNPSRLRLPRGLHQPERFRPLEPKSAQ
jgi:hypothetical protein